MVEVDSHGNSVLMKELKESFLSGGHTLSEWVQLTERPDLPDWSLWWITVDDADQARRLQQALGVHAGPRTMLEIEVRDDSGDTTGRAVVGIKEVKTNAGYYTAKVTHIASTNEEFADWGQLHFNELQDFELHFCRKVAHTCNQRSKSKSIGWFHVSCFRIISMLTALHHEYVAEGAIQYFSASLQDFMEEAAREKVQDTTKGTAPSKKEKKAKSKTKAAGGSASDEETKKKRAEQKREVLRQPGGRGDSGFAPGGGSGPSRVPKGDRPASPGVDRADSARLARESAEEATRALGHAGPQLIDRVRLTARREDVPGGGHKSVDLTQRGYGDGNQGRVHSFLDDIPEGSIDGFALSEGRGEAGARGRSRRRRQDKGSKDVGKDKKKKDKRSEKSSSPGRREHNLRGRNVIAPGKETKKGSRRDKGDPSSDPDSSSSGGGKKGKKKRKRSSSSSEDSKKKQDKRKKRKKEKKRKKDKKSSGSSTADSQEDLYGKETAKYESLVEKSRRNPGRLLRSGLEQMSKYLAARTGGEGGPTVSWRDQRVGAYLNQVLFNQHPPSVIGVRNRPPDGGAAAQFGRPPNAEAQSS